MVGTCGRYVETVDFHGVSTALAPASLPPLPLPLPPPPPVNRYSRNTTNKRGGGQPLIEYYSVYKRLTFSLHLTILSFKVARDPSEHPSVGILCHLIPFFVFFDI